MQSTRLTELHQVLLHAGHADSPPSGITADPLVAGGFLVFLAVIGGTWYLARC